MVFGNLSPRSLSGCARGRYQSSFCGSCHAMAELGRPWALTSGYDIAFLHLVMAVLEKAPVERLSCTAVPFRKLPVRRLSPDSRRWLTAVNMLLIEEKCRDDVADEGGLKAKLGLKLVRRQAERARETVSGSGFSGDLISTLSERQGELERETLPLERYAQPTSLLLGDIFAHASTLTGRPDFQAAMRQLGQGLGAAIYIKDAIDDLEKDRRRGRFNALLSGEHETVYAHRALVREVNRARGGLARMGMENGDAAGILSELLPAKPESTPLKRRRIAGYCDCCGGCDCGACDCGACDCGDAGACCDCSSACSCPCDGCTLDGCCGTSQSTTNTTQAQAVAVTPPRSPLHCPACGANLQPCDLGQVEVDECTTCNGLWLDHGELEQLADLKQLPPRLLSVRKINKMALRPEGTRPCPRCSKILVGTLVKGVRLDLCADCQGMWLDQGELNEILTIR